MTRTKATFWLAASCAALSLLALTVRAIWPGALAWSDASRWPEADRSLAGLLLLLPFAALGVCLARNVVGLATFGTFTPALLGLVLMRTGLLPGLLLLAAVILPAWWARDRLERLGLLSVPRSSVMLTLVCVGLFTALLAGRLGATPTTAVLGVLPLVILVGLVERLWSIVEESGTREALTALLGTTLTAASTALVLGGFSLEQILIRQPELVGVALAGQLTVGRYMGFRLLELYRFRELAEIGNNEWEADDAMAGPGRRAGGPRITGIEPTQRPVHPRGEPQGAAPGGR